MEESEGDEETSSEDSEYRERLARMREFANQNNQDRSQSRASSKMGRAKVACFEMICQRNNKVQEQKMFFFEKVGKR